MTPATDRSHVSLIADLCLPCSLRRAGGGASSRPRPASRSRPSESPGTAAPGRPAVRPRGGLMSAGRLTASRTARRPGVPSARVSAGVPRKRSIVRGVVRIIFARPPGVHRIRFMLLFRRARSNDPAGSLVGRGRARRAADRHPEGSIRHPVGSGRSVARICSRRSCLLLDPSRERRSCVARETASESRTRHLRRRASDPFLAATSSPVPTRPLRRRVAGSRGDQPAPGHPPVGSDRRSPPRRDDDRPVPASADRR